MTMGSESVMPAETANFDVLLTASLVSSLIMLDSNIVAVSLPAIGSRARGGLYRHPVGNKRATSGHGVIFKPRSAIGARVRRRSGSGDRRRACLCARDSSDSR
jgi:hypothetical protein